MDDEKTPDFDIKIFLNQRHRHASKMKAVSSNLKQDRSFIRKQTALNTLGCRDRSNMSCLIDLDNTLHWHRDSLFAKNQKASSNSNLSSILCVWDPTLKSEWSHPSQHFVKWKALAVPSTQWRHQEQRATLTEVKTTPPAFVINHAFKISVD